MPVRMDKAWRDFSSVNVAELTCHLGVFQLASETGEILYIGVAGGRSRYGLKGELQDRLHSPPANACKFRVEINMSYRTRHLELLQAYVHDHGRLPVGNTDIDIESLGRIRPGG